ncbi:MAG: GNAT family N-acetyltransferase [Acidobacteriaceae bacterium]
MKRLTSRVTMEAMPPIQVRKALKGDAEPILRCLRGAFEAYRHEYTPEAFEDTVLCADTLQSRLEEMTILVAVAESSVVGTIGHQARGAEGHLRGMAVLPESQGAGAASALLQAAESNLRKLGCTCVTLDTTEPLQRAIHFYKKHGYEASGRIRDFFGMRLHEYFKPLV